MRRGPESSESRWHGKTGEGGIGGGRLFSAGVRRRGNINNDPEESHVSSWNPGPSWGRNVGSYFSGYLDTTRVRLPERSVGLDLFSPERPWGFRPNTGDEDPYLETGERFLVRRRDLLERSCLPRPCGTRTDPTQGTLVSLTWTSCPGSDTTLRWTSRVIVRVDEGRGPQVNKGPRRRPL